MTELVTPSGPYSGAADKLRDMVAASATFQQETGTVDSAAALSKVFLRGARADEESPPLAAIRLNNEFGFRMTAGGSRNILRPRGGLLLYLNKRPDQGVANDRLQAELDAGNFFGDVLTDIAMLAGEDTHLPITEIEMLFFDRTDEEDHDAGLGDFFFAWFAVRWGHSR